MADSKKKYRAGIVGFRGYSGVELVRLLGGHPDVEPILLEHRSDAGVEFRALGEEGPKRLPVEFPAVAEAGLDAVFLATPPEVPMELAPKFLEAGMRVVDLSGAFRLRTVANYQRWYKEEHTAAGLLGDAVYGLPEFYRNTIRQARLVANPGCYPTAANLALRPLVRAGAIDLAAGVVCDAKSGVSGAGRKPSLKTSFCEVTENFSAYSLLGHRHVPEVLQNSDLEETQFSFTAQLIPIDRGILETIYFRATDERFTAARLVDLYWEAYEKEPFVKVYPAGQVPDLRSVQRTNHCGLGVAQASGGRTVVVAVIDNLVKGAAGQALQNLNLMLGLDETEGLR
ncbi:MAG: N-acetyl-gamma-glutamyl-phosphate reductase [Bryobacter sp.]|nr:N-acetyl-gamma-glutamyl-phosphate reductase [Bryobacter sp.]